MNKVIQAICGLLILAVLFPVTCTTYVEPDTIGVRQTLSGIDEQDFTQERVTDLPFFHTVHYLPRTVLFAHYMGSRALELRTSNNNDISVDATVSYRIKFGQGWKLVQEGQTLSTWKSKVNSAFQGFLREHFARLTNSSVQDPDVRDEVARSAVDLLNKKVAQYHTEVVAVNLRAVRFAPAYEQELMAKQRLSVQGELDVAKELLSKAKQKTDTATKAIDKDTALMKQAWRTRVEEARNDFEIRIATVNAEATQYNQTTRAATDADCARAKAEGELAQAQAQALWERLRADALNSRAGRIYTAVQAAERFELSPDLRLNAASPGFLGEFGSMATWESFLLGGQ